MAIGRGQSKSLLAAALFNLALQLEQEDQWAVAHDLYWRLQQDFAGIPSLSGLPMGQLALLRLTPLVMQHFELIQRHPLRESFSSGSSGPNDDSMVLHGLMHRASEIAVLYPSALSERLLDLSEAWEQKRFPNGLPLTSVLSWRELWMADEAARALYEDWRHNPKPACAGFCPAWKSKIAPREIFSLIWACFLMSPVAE